MIKRNKNQVSVPDKSGSEASAAFSSSTIVSTLSPFSLKYRYYMDLTDAFQALHHTFWLRAFFKFVKVVFKKTKCHAPQRSVAFC